MMDANLIRCYLAVRIVQIGAFHRLDIQLTIWRLIRLPALIIGNRKILLRIGRAWNRMRGGIR